MLQKPTNTGIKNITINEAVIRGGVYIGKGISKSQAIARMKSRKDTWSTSRSQSRGVAVVAAANPKGDPINEVDKYKSKPKKLVLLSLASL
ncbi:hypothetical protein BA81_14831 [Bacillus safensis FO-36b]|uniref:hypothetical protein n=1 Tax=Bacillus safensis TaxID=561879 RepID=UPI00045D0D54|nr:hypothetical protein [Bacillus safensis]AWI35443.1 hypothetical protein RS87_01595 [Bacillus safensis FO-36b]KDE26449.1 hypothetical protein BA81_14831 [Bacillus safensis FO-36b]MCM3049996.1 hypothetical protein [Bacillus safensis]MEC1047710.1 hypothetical protein [Bacillus safensis]